MLRSVWLRGDVTGVGRLCVQLHRHSVWSAAGVSRRGHSGRYSPSVDAPCASGATTGADTAAPWRCCFGGSTCRSHWTPWRSHVADSLVCKCRKCRHGWSRFASLPRLGRSQPADESGAGASGVRLFLSAEGMWCVTIDTCIKYS